LIASSEELPPEENMMYENTSEAKSSDERSLTEGAVYVTEFE